MSTHPVVRNTRLSHGGTARSLSWGSGPADLVLLHPNGFCGGVFAPVADRLQRDMHVLALDLRGHGGSSESFDAPLTYEAMAADVLEVFDDLEVDAPIVVGESLGGAVAVLLDRLAPGRARGLLLCEAVAFPARADGPAENPLSSAARRRRSVWPSTVAMHESYSARPPMSELAADAMDAYLLWGTKPTPDGDVELACSPEFEAAIFELAPTPMGGGAAWEHLAALSCPAEVIAGSSSFLPTDFFVAQANRLGTQLHVVGGGHFFLQADAGHAEQLIRAGIEALRSD
jgi:pimeloyl-ACP methyl ester carboxylesterase